VRSGVKEATLSACNYSVHDWPRVDAKQLVGDVKHDTGAPAWPEHAGQQWMLRLIFRALPMRALSMKHASYSATGVVSSVGKALRPSRHKGLFTIILEAIYESRRRQTEKTLRRYQNLLGVVDVEQGQADESERSRDK
jgi:hypothetical protein